MGSVIETRRMELRPSSKGYVLQPGTIRNGDRPALDAVPGEGAARTGGQAS